jgi:hypothetical protein
MKNLKLMALAGVFAFLAFGSTAQQGSGGCCDNNKYGRLFDKTTIVDLKGTIASIEQIVPEKGMSVGIHLLVKVENQEPISVHLGPEWYLDRQEVQLIVGDEIVVTGSKISYNRTPAIIAMEVEKDGVRLVIRDEKGFQQWNAWRRKSSRRWN